ncbi:serine/arginine-rich splicing factor RSZ22-like [Aricia agestis]|uniref:serine/arginine-rich splicing factor RSZ22-like n=1 Tax=Aricia agestis TaxID=91739 RepID=UPI001C202733|nr:serine/arginine-rich splicing factor RSZ22-like [Aricia agestis]
MHVLARGAGLAGRGGARGRRGAARDGTHGGATGGECRGREPGQPGRSPAPALGAPRDVPAPPAAARPRPRAPCPPPPALQRPDESYIYDHQPSNCRGCRYVFAPPPIAHVNYRMLPLYDDAFD